MMIDKKTANKIIKELSETDMESGELEAMEKKIQTLIKTNAILITILKDKGILSKTEIADTLDSATDIYQTLTEE